MKKILLLISLFTLKTASCCEINLTDKLLLINETDDVKNLKSYQNCNEKTLREVLKTLHAIEGSILAQQLIEILKLKNLTASIFPEKIEILHLSKILKKELNFPLQSELLIKPDGNLSSILYLENSDSLQFDLNLAKINGNKKTSLNILKRNHSKLEFNFQYELKNMVRAYRLNKSIPAFSEINKNDLVEVYVENVPFGEILQSTENLNFFSTNKPLKEGSILGKADLNGVNLVRAGRKIEIIMENDHIKIKTHGLARKNGSIGEIIDVYNPQKNKIYTGTIIGPNKVVVEL